MTRETKEIITPISAQKIVVYPWLTGGERRQLANELLKHGIEATATGQPKNVTAEANDALDFLAWKIVIVSIDGKSENIIEDIKAMRDDDYVFVTGEVNRILRGVSIEEKKTI